MKSIAKIKENPFRPETHNHKVFDYIYFKKRAVHHRMAVELWDCNRLASRIQNIEDKCKELNIDLKIKTKSIFINNKMFTQYYI